MRALGGFCARHARAIVALGVMLSLAAGVYGAGAFDAARPFGFNDPDSESSRAYDALEEATGEDPVPRVLVMVRSPSASSGESGVTRVQRVARRLRRIDGIARVVTPEADPTLESTDGRMALVAGFLESGIDDPAAVGRRVKSEFDGVPGVSVGGFAPAAEELNDRTETDLRRIELLAAPLLILISFLVFRGFIAALLPLLVGGLSIAFTLAALRALTEVMVIDLFALNVVTVLGLGLAIDYSLFMVSRYREELAVAGYPSAGVIKATLQPVGRMVCFSAATVAGSVASLAVFPQDFLRSAGVGCALVTIVSALVVLILLPAVLSLLGGRVNALAPRRFRGTRPSSAFWRRLARGVLRHPVPIATVVAAAMVLAGLPFMRAQLTRADARVLPGESSARQVDEEIRTRFSSDPSTTLLVVFPETRKDELGRAAVRRVDRTAGIDHASLESGGGLTWIEARTSTPAYSESSVDVVGVLRRIDWGAPTLVSGPSAELTDQRESLREHLPLATGIVLAVTATALAVMTGSAILPLLALLCNFLTVSVAFGVLVLVFQEGRFETLLSYDAVGALDTSVPILLFAVIFGLSTDYGIFLLSRIAEARSKGTGGSAAIAAGLEGTGRIITAAALLFAVAMGSFVFSQLIFIKEVAVGTALAVLVDATLVRALLLPALMRIFGSRVWWSPRLIRRLGTIRA